MTMLYAQHGYAVGNKITEALKLGIVQGVVFGPRDITPDQITSRIKEYKSVSKKVECVIDPQYYACFLANKSDARLGNLIGNYPYFSVKRRSDLEREAFVKKEIQACLDFQNHFEISYLISPSILIPRSFNSIEGVIAKHFFRITGDLKSKYKKPVYSSLIISRDALLEKEELDIFLDEVTSLDPSPDGVYLLISAQSAESRFDIFNADVLAGWMFINHALSINSVGVLNGYSDILTPFLGCVGAKAGATGWWTNLRTFSLDKFQPNEGGGRLPNQRYLSKTLLNRITFFEFHGLRKRFPEIINGLPSDTYYPERNGSEPERSKEILQSWDAINNLCKEVNPRNIEKSLGTFLDKINKAMEIYDKIEAENPISMEEKSRGTHLEALAQAISIFGKKAEIIPSN